MEHAYIADVSHFHGNGDPREVVRCDLPVQEGGRLRVPSSV